MKQAIVLTRDVFQSALPMRGATIMDAIQMPERYEFQSALPMRGATRVRVAVLHAQPISIRAPHAGSDVESHYCSPPPLIFQSALPLRGATDAI